MSHCIQKEAGGGPVPVPSWGGKGSEKRAKQGNSQLTKSGNGCKCQQHFLYMRVYTQPYLLMVGTRKERVKAPWSKSVHDNIRTYMIFRTKMTDI